jgi:hypothetical protein
LKFPAHPAAERSAIGLMTFAAFLICLLFAYFRGGWMDEFLTHEVTDPTVSVAKLFHERWLSDQHPPTFYFLEWLWRRAFGIDRDIPAMRMLPWLLSLCLTLLSFSAWRSLFGEIRTFAFMLLTSPVLIYFSEEARSYVLSFHAGVLLGMFVLAVRDAETRTRHWFWISMTGVLGSALATVHVISLLTAGFLLALLILDRARARDKAGAAVAFALGIFVLSPALLWVVVALSGARDALSGFWITRWELLQTLVWLLPAFGAPVVLVFIFSAREQMRRPAAWWWRASWPLFAALIFLGVAVAVSALKPFLVLRYLSLLIGFTLPAAATLAKPWLETRTPAVFAAAFVAALASGAALAAITPHDGGEWKRPGTYVASLPACHGAQIPVALLTFVPTREAMSSWGAMFGWYAGDDARFVPATRDALAETAGNACPVKLWIADIVERYASPDMRQAIRTTCDEHKNAEVLAFRRGYLIVTGAEAARLWRGARSSCEALESIRPRNAEPD